MLLVDDPNILEGFDSAAAEVAGLHRFSGEQAERARRDRNGRECGSWR